MSAIPLTVIICGSREHPFMGDLADFLAESGVTAVILPSLYDLPPAGSAAEFLQSVAGDLIVLAPLFPRAAYWTLRALGFEGRMGGSESSGAGGRAIWCLDVRSYKTAESLLEEVRRVAGRGAGCQGAATSSAVPAAPVNIDESAASRWYPVLDFARCVNCLECLNFCLFGVYGLDEEGRIFVEQPDACRDGCPACARICPASAILFPADRDPAIAGDDSAPQASGATGCPSIEQRVRQLAEAERQQAVKGSLADGKETTPTDLDRLVAGLDELD